jgi:hypothetical protein
MVARSKQKISLTKQKIYSSLIVLLICIISVHAQEKIIVETNGKGNFTTIQEAVNSLPSSVNEKEINIDWLFKKKWNPLMN